MQRKLIKHIVLFFIPVILGCVLVEYLVREIPESYQYNATHLDTNKDDIEVLVLGSSQSMNAINAALIDAPTLNLASGDQHHDTDFKIAKALLPRLPKLKTVVLEVSYNHFEQQHNGLDFWKNSIYLEYYGIDNFDHNTYFKDRSLFLSQHTLFSKKLYDYYVKNERNAGFNRYGFDTLNFNGTFQKWNYDESIIAKKNFKINLQPSLDTWHTNSEFFIKMLGYFRSKNIQVIIAQVPMHTSFLAKREPIILLRKNEIVTHIKTKYPAIIHVNREEDTLRFNVRDFINPSHLNPKGAAKYTKILSGIINRHR